MKAAFVINPRAGNGQAVRIFNALEAEARRLLGPFDAAVTEGPGDGARLARAAAEAGADVVVSVGGDGTASEVAGGIVASGQGAALGVVPVATGGDLGRTLGLARRPLEALARIARGRRRRIDVGLVRMGDGLGRVFVNVASFGMSGEVDLEVASGPRFLGGRMAFFLATARVLWRRAGGRRVRIRVDDGPWAERQVAVVAVANGRSFGGGMRVAPDARMDDALFDVVTIPPRGLLRSVASGWRIYAGRHLALPGVTCVRARVVEVAAADGLGEIHLDVDGEVPGTLPARFEVLPAAMEVVV